MICTEFDTDTVKIGSLQRTTLKISGNSATRLDSKLDYIVSRLQTPKLPLFFFFGRIFLLDLIDFVLLILILFL